MEEGAKSTETESPALITVNVQFSGQKFPISISPDSTIKELKSRLQPLTNVLPRGQKLICKGKVLADAMSLKSLQIVNGSKVMLVATQGLHQGDGPTTRDVKKNQNVNRASATSYKPAMSNMERCKITGVVALSECGLKVVPDEVWDCGLCVRVLDLSNNLIREISAKICSMKHLNKLLINANDISDESISWESLSSLKYLAVLSLSQNQLTTLPSALGSLTSLSQLHISKNMLTSLPDELGLLNQLQVLKANNNRISLVPPSIGNCCSLIEIDFSSNLLIELPETFGKLRNLKALHLSNNGLKSLPSTLFKMCTQLSILNLHGTEITNDVLRQIEGWEDFDERRRLKHQKQLDFRVGSSGVFDEGADDDNRP
ncbi:uncharacterized protein A4U43_C07F5790 [Asparagus officinalis]|uniref:Ubiquitin-like domain-containing protein n=1 Tax=Asparagus officinalis TaxID=4686 RepID=A0A5P1EEX3_ASPOF|nr:plant intracellular Ras-group-related LRR protein 8 [Asparagus officinalis]ONK62600.1 uncharacterized protein A4U43_C07F5790 [Asparagus officinalis]